MSPDPRVETSVKIRRIVESDRDALRALRLRSLATDPMSFGSTFAKESAGDLAKWTNWAHLGATSLETAVLVAEQDNGNLVGMVGAYWNENITHLYGMWVEPGHRHLGLGGRLLDEILVWGETVHPTSEIRLGVVPLAGSAVRLYQSRGFVPTGKVEPLPHTPSVVVHEMVWSRKKPGAPAVR
ncbi:MAG: GNAT family N-acetyltransferase [Thermoplasmata archaeon]|jgi:ribosomal protein S18 acetylase RimI-like enzyme